MASKKKNSKNFSQAVSELQNLVNSDASTVEELEDEAMKSHSGGSLTGLSTSTSTSTDPDYNRHTDGFSTVTTNSGR